MTSPTTDHIDASLDLTACDADAPTDATQSSRTLAGTDFPRNIDFPRNEVRLTGRISAIGEPTRLPSGDVVVNLRLVVPREHPVGRPASTARPRPSGEDAEPSCDASAVRPRPGVDTIDIACWTPATQRAAGRVGVQGMAEVTGVLRRRFFRAHGAPSSRYEVEATRIRRARGDDAVIRTATNTSAGEELLSGQ